MSWRLRVAMAVGMVVAAAVGPGLAVACSCMWAGPFTRVALGQSLVILADVVSHEANSIKVRVVEVLEGDEPRRTIRIWGDDGALCRPYVSGFRAGTRWLFAVARLPERGSAGVANARRGFHSPPGDRQYAMSVCGEFWVEVQGERAIGRIVVGQFSTTRESVPLSDLLAWLRSGGTAPVPVPAPLAP